MSARTKRVFWLLFLMLPVLPAAILCSWFGMLYRDPSTIDTARYDIDGDGSRELILLRYGPTSGVFTLDLVGVKNCGIAYDDVFHMPSWGDSHVLAEHDGALCICAENDSEKRYLEIGTEDGHFTLAGHRSTWQGDSPFQAAKDLYLRFS